MQLLFNTFAETASSGSLFEALGIDVRLLVLQTIAFLLLVGALAKWVYPVFIRAIDNRQEALEAGMKASQEAQKQAEKSEKAIQKEIHEARKQADDILAAARKESNVILAETEEKAKRRAENIVAEAKAEMNNQLQAARESLKSETRKLVAEATEVIIDEKIDPSKDAKLIDRALTQAQERG
ncbi:MAG: atpF [Candidatus Saccharibacteria bacterium]|nr:atpF [Candidatus Saccharibacteria bacterium]